MENIFRICRLLTKKLVRVLPRDSGIRDCLVGWLKHSRDLDYLCEIVNGISYDYTHSGEYWNLLHTLNKNEFYGCKQKVFTERWLGEYCSYDLVWDTFYVCPYLDKDLFLSDVAVRREEKRRTPRFA